MSARQTMSAGRTASPRLGRTRREASGGALLAALAAVMGRPALAAPASLSRNDDAFNARSLEAAMKALGLPEPIDSDKIVIDAPDVAENGANVPVEVTAKLFKATRILVIGEKNIFPLLADVSLTAAGETTSRVEPWIELKVKLAETSRLRVLVEADGMLYHAARSVRVIVGGCLPG
jgi:sulfur-oxidizing protein SoxY